MAENPPFQTYTTLKTVEIKREMPRSAFNIFENVMEVIVDIKSPSIGIKNINIAITNTTISSKIFFLDTSVII